MSYSFGDDDSVAEELEESLNESLEVDENYSDDDYTEDNFSSSVPAVQTSAINLDDLVLSPVPLDKTTPKRRTEASLTKKAKSENKSSTDDDDYSLSFDDLSENYTAYSEDFDNDLTGLSISRGSTKKHRHGSVSFQQTQQSPALPGNSPPQLPSLAMQSLEAERAMEKLSKEIVHLRNQQRLALRDRRVEAVRKKTRAEERRQQHQRALVEAQHQAEVLGSREKSLMQRVEILEQATMGAEETRDLSMKTLKSTQEVVEQQKEMIERLLKEVSELETRAAEKEDERIERESVVEREKKELRARLVTAELHVQVMARSNEAAEER